MEFISLPPDADSHLLVPDLGGPEYDGKGFETFGQRCGWDTEKLITEGIRYVEERRLDSSCKCEVGQFMQTWLCFGIINVVLEKPVKRIAYSAEALYDDGHTGHVLDTSTLLEDLTPKMHDIQRYIQENDGTLPVRYTSVIQALPCAASFLARFNSSQTRDLDAFWPREVHLQLSIFLEALIRGINPPGQNLIMSTKMKLILYDRILADEGWCPYDVERLGGLQDAGLYYLSRSRNRSFSSVSDHQDCSKDYCLRINVDWDSYQTCHVNDQCQCNHIDCDWLQVAVMLGEKHIPVVTVEEGRKGLYINLHCSKNHQLPYPGLGTCVILLLVVYTLLL